MEKLKACKECRFFQEVKVYGKQDSCFKFGYCKKCYRDDEIFDGDEPACTIYFELKD